MADSLDRRFTTPEELNRLGQELLQQARFGSDDETFWRHMSQAKILGLNWLEGLESVVFPRFGSER